MDKPLSTPGVEVDDVALGVGGVLDVEFRGWSNAVAQNTSRHLAVANGRDGVDDCFYRPRDVALDDEAHHFRSASFSLDLVLFDRLLAE